MDYIEVLKKDLSMGYSQRDLELLIGLPKNNLSNVLKGKKSLSRKSELKIERWNKSEKPNPLDLPKETVSKVVITDLNTPTNVQQPKSAPKTNFTVDNLPKGEKVLNKAENASNEVLDSEPVKMEGESGIDFAIRKSDWAAKNKK